MGLSYYEWGVLFDHGVDERFDVDAIELEIDLDMGGG
jgi:hypothetical protein